MVTKVQKFNSQGFTLVELLIVIMIIGVMATIGMYYVFGIVADARDAKRLSDLGFISKFFSIYYTDHGYYPPSATLGQSSDGCAITPKAESECQELAQEMKPYATKLPYDPNDYGTIDQPDCISSPCYFYKTIEPTHDSFCLCTDLEGMKNRSKPSACESMNFNYCVATLL